MSKSNSGDFSGSGQDQGKKSPDVNERDERLLEILLDNNLISSGQADVLRMDRQISGMPVEEILLARGWAEEKKLESILAGVETGKSATASNTEPLSTESRKYEASDDYQENLRRYRSLLAELLGESSE